MSSIQDTKDELKKVEADFKAVIGKIDSEFKRLEGAASQELERAKDHLGFAVKWVKYHLETHEEDTQENAAPAPKPKATVGQGDTPASTSSDATSNGASSSS